MKTLHELIIHNRFHELGPHFYYEVSPQGLSNPSLVQSNPQGAKLLGLHTDVFSTDFFLRVFSGNAVLPGSRPLAHDYAGHQFGRFNPFLGDGRVVVLGTVESAEGIWEINLKGAGKTPYARQADGRAGLSECLHEYQISEQLAALGVPTTRCLCVTAGDQQVYRQGFEPAAILTRLAPSHIRFGTFENYYFQRNEAALRQLVDYVIHHHYPECARQDERRYSCFFRDVVTRTARLIAHWQAVGFVHGMMNTDNQSILGVTLDLGASGFNPDHESDFVSSPSDTHGRYAFGQQPLIGLWNCNVLARALSPLIAARELRDILQFYEPEYLRHFTALDSVASSRT